MNAIPEATAPHFRHEAFLYSGADDFADRAMPIINRALANEEPILIAVDQPKIELLRDLLGSAANSVGWKDIRGIGRNPARIIPLWRQFVTGCRRGGPLWGFGEPIWAGRGPAELVEAQRHEQLINLAFAEAAGFTLLCPYDTSSLDPDIVHEAHHSHPFVSPSDSARSIAFVGVDPVSAAFQAPFADPPRESSELPLTGVSLAGIRRFLTDHSSTQNPAIAGIDDLAIAIAAVTACMGRPGARLRVWREAATALAELSYLEPMADPLAGREWPPPSKGATRGLWIANQLCDLVQLRSFDTAAVVRLRLSG